MAFQNKKESEASRKGNELVYCLIEGWTPGEASGLMTAYVKVCSVWLACFGAEQDVVVGNGYKDVTPIVAGEDGESYPPGSILAFLQSQDLFGDDPESK